MKQKDIFPDQMWVCIATSSGPPELTHRGKKEFPGESMKTNLAST